MTKKILKEFCNRTGISGREESVCELAKTYLSQYGETIIDNSQNVICKIGAHSRHKKNLLLDAHIDQVGFLVTHIDDSGFVKISDCGKIDPRIMIGASLTIHGKKDVIGTVCSIPPHLKSDTNSVSSIEDLVVDTGIMDGTISSTISLGDTVSFATTPLNLLNNRLAASGIDNRAGVTTLVRCAQILSDSSSLDLNYNITIVLSSQEETTAKGIKTSAHSLLADEAIAVDVSFASQPQVPEHKTGMLLNGPMIGISPILDRRMFDKFILTAKEKNIPYQVEVMNGKTSTNADHISVDKNGVKTALISIPIRYMHTPFEVVDVNDIENSVKLIVEYVKSGGIN